MDHDGASATTDDVLGDADLHGRRVVVTGASTGLGEETARALASRGAAVTMTARDAGRGDAAAERIRASFPDADLEVRILDLASLAQVRASAADFLADHDTIDILVNNAGVMACPRADTADGFELQLGTNHLGHFLLSSLLMPALLAAPSARVVALSSRGHRFADVDLEDPNFGQSQYDPWIAYGRSKTANALFAVELDRRYREEGVRAFSVHPGMILTELGRHLTEEALAALRDSMPSDAQSAWKTIPQGAATTVWAATSAELDGRGGLYLEDCHIATPTADPGAMEGVRTYAMDPTRARDLWRRSEEWVGISG